jgi:hypothetical protein
MKVIEKPSEDLWQKYSLWKWGIKFSRAYTYWGGAVVDIENLREILFRRSPDLQRIRLFGNKVRSFRYV